MEVESYLHDYIGLLQCVQCGMDLVPLTLTVTLQNTVTSRFCKLPALKLTIFATILTLGYISICWTIKAAQKIVILLTFIFRDISERKYYDCCLMCICTDLLYFCTLISPRKKTPKNCIHQTSVMCAQAELNQNGCLCWNLQTADHSVIIILSVRYVTKYKCK